MSSVCERGEIWEGIDLRSVKVLERVIGGESRWSVDEVLVMLLLQMLFAKTHEA